MSMVTVPFVHRPAAIEPQQTLIHELLPHTKTTRCTVDIAARNKTTGQYGSLGVFMSRPESEQWSDTERRINIAVMLRLHRWEKKQDGSKSDVRSAGSVTSSTRDSERSDDKESDVASVTGTKRKVAPTVTSSAGSVPKRPRRPAPNKEGRVVEVGKEDNHSAADDESDGKQASESEDSEDHDSEGSGSASDEEPDEQEELKRAARNFPAERFGPTPAEGTQAREVWEKAIMGDTKARWVLGANYYGLDVYGKDTPDLSSEIKCSNEFAVAWLAKAVKAGEGEPDAMWLLGSMHKDDEAPNSNRKLARRLLADAANKNHVGALIEYGDLLQELIEEGKGQTSEQGGFSLVSNSFAAYWCAFHANGSPEAERKADELQKRFPSLLSGRSLRRSPSSNIWFV